MPSRFAPRCRWTLLTVLAVAAFLWLGSWQYGRGVHRREQWQSFESSGAVQAADAAALRTLPRYTRVQVRGWWDRERQFLLDNISHDGAPGYEVLTVLKLDDGSRLLVNRGWVPFSGYRDRLPDIALAETEAGEQRLAGRLGDLPVGGLSSGRQPPATEGPWPRLTSFPAHEELERSHGTRLLAPVLLLDPDSGAGYLRQWRPPGVSPERHFGYALQWWLFAAVALGLYVLLNLKRKT